MPPTGLRDAPYFAERLKVPAWWWLVALLCVGVGGAEVFAGFTWRIALIVYLVLGVPTAVLLGALSRTRILVDAAGLHAFGATLAADEVTEVRMLDAQETRQMLGPAGDPAAHVAVRGYVQCSVLLRTSREDQPYWLVSTRHPQRLVDALARSRSVTA